MAGGNSYNGWPASDNPDAINIEPFGDAVGLPFPGGVKGGDVTTVMAYLCTQFHYRVEPIVSGWDWGWSYRANVNNPSSLSCHASGTAVDLNAPDHPNGSSGTFNDNQVGEIYAILNELQGGVDWLEGYDEMHFEIAVSAGTLANIAAQLPAGGGTPQPEPEPEPVLMEDDDVMYLLKIAGGDGKIYAASVAGRRFYYIGNPDSLAANQLAGTYTADVAEIDSGQMNHVRYACQIQADDDPATPIP
jgi:D-alanyl-D-alanine carboxypeptidase